MKTLLFTYESPVRTFWIRPEPAGRVQLGIDRRKLRTYGSPSAAASDVAGKEIGWWDRGDALPPGGLRHWKRPATAAKKVKREAD